MEQQPNEIGVKIYSPSPQSNFNQIPPPPPPMPPQFGNRRRRAMANGVQKTLSKTSMLVNFLPTGTLLTFEMVLPSVYGKGECTMVTTLMINVLLGICTCSCFFFHFTDSFRGTDGKMYYGFVTPWGLKVFKPVQEMEVPKDERYILGFTDFVHAMMSSMVFVAIAFSDHRVTNCLFPNHTEELDEVMQSFPLMVGIVCSGLFLVFPNTRYGIGCLSA
ncbi:protein DMP9-like [Rutidosis leptorrhynchoides]|uniref:protein DMP9-like n=1 Tax=Rutidosis leptorrhynchoides TaxID=125765 RepID=UPI003A99362E